MSDTLLGVIAAAVVVIALTHLAVAVVAVRASLQALALVKRLEDDFKPLLGQVRAIVEDLARTSTLAAVQVQRVDDMTTRLAGLADEAAASLSHNVLTPLRDGMALLRGIMGAFRGVQDRVSEARRPSGDAHDDTPGV